MSKRHNGLERLRAINPCDETEVGGADGPRAERLLAEIIATPKEETSTRPQYLRNLRLAVVLAVLALFTIAAAWVFTRSIETPNAVSCHQAVALDSNVVAAAPAGGPATADACAPVWQDAVLINPQIVRTGSVPPLTACVAADGSLAVFPTDDSSVCSQFGLAVPDAETQPEADELREVEDSLIIYFQSQPCLPVDAAEAEVRDILDRAGLSDWNVESEPATDDRPCASHSFRTDLRTVILIPIPEG